ncbi:twin-arginine translocase TatA/TatE family subunit [Pedomonas mirosovicensis]|uniref:twin-arginine translocase TatA/TatE family subunit n=1 Tax=Pedomonas mirosovicensis TaxID=2908641 RepID=UPI00216A776E|nr:twin-arginine translocase TatA/TatE family subunit [Pedomonas mirosovicensis]MCH8685555.1 twin-arginine translocase TatA/TatE family subunit [Pedomonas mirosovicensis]
MGSFSLLHWAVLILVVILLFGRGRISDIMGDVAKGIKSFKKGITDEPETHNQPAAPQPQQRIAGTDRVESAGTTKEEAKS